MNTTQLGAFRGRDGNIRLVIVVGSTSHIFSWDSGKVVVSETGSLDDLFVIDDCDPTELCLSIRRLADSWGADEEASSILDAALSQPRQYTFKTEMDKMAAKPAKTAKIPAKKAAKKTAAKKEAVAKQETKAATTGRRSVSGRIKELIMEGRYTDDKIFAIVKKEFELDDNKRSYIAWNRSDLRRKGANPPEAAAE